MSHSLTAPYRACREPGGCGMSQLMGADTRRIDLISDGLQRYSQDVLNLRDMAARAVIEMRDAWVGGDFAHVAQSWEQEAGPLLADAAASLSAMVAVLRVQAAEQRRVSGDAGSTGAQAVTGRTHLDAVGPQGNPGYGGSLASVGVDLAGIDDVHACLLYTSPSPRDRTRSRMPSSA